MEQPLFRASEVLDMAIQIEIEGVSFYNACIQAALGKEIEDVFHYLVHQEQEHIQVFKGMKKSVEDYPLPEQYPGEARSYIASFVKDQVFYGPPKVLEQAGEIAHPLGAIEFAIGFEKRSILFYSGVKQVVRASEKEAIEKVMDAEHGHVRRLLALRSKLESESGS